MLLLLSICYSCGGEEAQATAKEDLKSRTEVKKPGTTSAQVQQQKQQQQRIAQQRAAQQKMAQQRAQQGSGPTSANIAGNVDVGDYKAKNKGWLVNFEEAFKLSEASGKPIMANFTGSDWCGWCKRLDKSVFHQSGFDKWAKDNVILLELDFPKRFRVPQTVAQQNNGLKQAFGVRGFPTIWLFDADKDDTGRFNFQKLGKMGYTKTLKEFTGKCDSYLSTRKQS